MLTSILIFLPIAGALFVWIVPWPTPRAAGGAALLVALAELIVWVNRALNFDYGNPGLQDEASHSWFSDLGVSYTVGLFDFSLWLVGLTVVVTTAAVAYGFWSGRERLGVYLGLLLFLEGATVGVFAAQDLLLFYVFWEAMMIPLYILIGVWGGPGRVGATIKFVIYTLAGSLLMLVSVIALGLSAGTFDMREIGESSSTWIFLGFAAAFAVKAPIWPFHGWLPDTYRESPAEVSAILSGVISKAATYGFLRIGLVFFPSVVADWRTVILVLATIGLVYGSLLAFRAPDIRGVIAYSSLAQVNLIVIGLFAVNDSGLSGALLQMVTHGLVSAVLFLLAGAVERRAATGDLSRLGGMARGRPHPRDDAHHRGSDRPRGARVERVRGRVPDPERDLHARLGLGRRGRSRDRARGDVHAPSDLRGPPPGSGPGGHRRGARPSPGRDQRDRPARHRPARALVLAGGDHRPLLRREAG